MTTMQSPVLAVDGLRSGYGDIVAIRDVALSVKAGEIVTVLGLNGAGKTTLMNTIVGLMPTMSGTIEFVGEPVQHQRAHARSMAGIALVQENKRVFRRMTVEDNLFVAAPRVSRKEFAEQEAAVVELFPLLHERRHQRAGELSGGQQQMLAIGQALISQPRVLLLDEPSAGLAPKLVREVMERVVEIAKRGIGVLLVEQAVREALRITDRVYVLRLGECREERDFRSTSHRELLQRLYLDRGEVTAADG